MQSDSFDLVVVGAGVMGLSVARAGLQKGYRVLVVERHHHANGASIRNFGFVTVTGQRRGGHWRRAMRTRNIWARIAPRAGISIEHEGLLVAARRPQAADVLHAFMATEMGEQCRFLTREQALSKIPALAQGTSFSELLYSPHELRVESSVAIPKLAKWLESMGVVFRYATTVHEIDHKTVSTRAGEFIGERIVVCPGDNFDGPFACQYQQAGLSHCTLQMLRVAAGSSCALASGLMSDLSLVRYEGYRLLPEAVALLDVLGQEASDALANGVHLIAVKSADGSLIVGDSHQYSSTPNPFSDETVDDLILGELLACVDLPDIRVTSRWTGSYAHLKDHVYCLQRPSPHIRSIIVTGGTGASTGLALGEDVLADLDGEIQLDEKGTEP